MTMITSIPAPDYLDDMPEIQRGMVQTYLNLIRPIVEFNANLEEQRRAAESGKLTVNEALREAKSRVESDTADDVVKDLMAEYDRLYERLAEIRQVVGKHMAEVLDRPLSVAVQVDEAERKRLQDVRVEALGLYQAFQSFAEASKNTEPAAYEFFRRILEDYPVPMVGRAGAVTVDSVGKGATGTIRRHRVDIRLIQDGREVFSGKGLTQSYNGMTKGNFFEKGKAPSVDLMRSKWEESSQDGPISFDHEGYEVVIEPRK